MGVIDYQGAYVQKKFPNNQNPDKFGSNIPRIEILIIKDLLL